LIVVRDRVRDEASPTITELRRSGVRTVMITGDNWRTARAIGGVVGVDEYHAELLPEDKVKMIEELSVRYGGVAMVGDGVKTHQPWLEPMLG